MLYILYILLFLVLLVYLPYNSKLSKKLKLKISVYYILFYPIIMPVFTLITDYLGSIYKEQHLNISYLLSSFKFEITIVFTLILVLIIKSKQTKRESPSNWNNFREYILEHRSLSIALSALIIAIGMVGAGIVNFLSTDSSASNLSDFNVGGITFLFLLSIGIFLLSPLLNFKYKYNFISEFDNLNAQFVYKTFKRASNLRTSTKGLISIQLFEIHENTNDSAITFKFNQIWSSKDSNSTVNKIKKSSINVPLTIWEFLSDLSHEKKLDGQLLNQFTIDLNESKKSKDKKIYIDPMYLLALHDYLKESFFLQTVTTKKPDLITSKDADKSILQSLDSQILKELEDSFQTWKEDWDIPIDLFSYDYKSIHYVTFFNLIKEPFFKDLNIITNEVENKNSIYQIEDIVDHNMNLIPEVSLKIENLTYGNKNNIILWEDLKKNNILSNHIYKGFYEGQSSEKSNRCYYNLMIRTSSIEEGQKNFIILMVCDNRFIPKIENALTLHEIMLK